MTRAVIFDLDETLVVEEPAVLDAFLATAQVAADRRGLDAAALAVAARRRARELWRAAPTYPYCRDIGISSWEGLWCRFAGDGAGASCLQREKLAASGLAEHFDVVLVSAEHGTGKPDPSIFASALGALGVEPHDAVMVGDSLPRDVAGAAGAGMRAVWINRFGQPRSPDATDVVEIVTLEELALA